MFNVEIQADNGKWFLAEDGGNVAAEAADALVATLRSQGFNARASFAA